jgi:hypothetical protein
VLSESLQNAKISCKINWIPAIPSKIIRLNKIPYKLLRNVLVNISNEFLKFKMFSLDYPVLGFPPTYTVDLWLYFIVYIFIARASTGRFPPDGQKNRIRGVLCKHNFWWKNKLLRISLFHRRIVLCLFRLYQRSSAAIRISIFIDEATCGSSIFKVFYF